MQSPRWTERFHQELRDTNYHGQGTLDELAEDSRRAEALRRGSSPASERVDEDAVLPASGSDSFCGVPPCFQCLQLHVLRAEE